MKPMQGGQAMLEAMGFAGIISILLSHALLELHKASVEAQRRVDHSRAIILQPAPDQSIRRQSDYPFAQATQRVLEPLSRLSRFSLPQDNLWLLERTEDTVAMARLTDGWGPQQQRDLSERPAQLTPAYYVSELGLNSLLEVLSWLPVTREFDPDSLRLGYINTEATPLETFCEEEPC
ncbi:hypothetical protein [Pseudidiomarina sp.]|uniref:hypothetical protein n=1 Tax=Pseudidiomarina sp. TaxID=2081707 RepID=UPI00299E1A92|nr:hypothetical protein [Pseudidiomarina sp.]MDX1706253.1 hypothetical protein [Pseudidiomarina sp.]